MKFLKLQLLILFLILITGCSIIKDSFALDKHNENMIEIKTSSIDLEILKKANKILKDEKSWEKKPLKICQESKKHDLFCALEEASIEITGNYRHTQPALQEVRLVIEERYSERWENHRFEDFNSHKETTFKDVKNVLNEAIKNLKKKIKNTLPIVERSDSNN